MSLLVTSSLIGAVEWFRNSPPSWKEKAYTDLYNQLARKPWDKIVPDVQRGMDFESRIYETLKNKRDDKIEFTCSPEFQIFLDACRGGTLQKTLKRIVTIDEKEYCLYGRTDVYFPGHIIDIKACAEYKGESKYLGTIQHKMYSYIDSAKTGTIPDFTYMVAEFGPCPNMKIQRVFSPKWTWEGTVEDLKDEVFSRIRLALSYIDADKELKELYEHTFSKDNS